MTLGEQILLLRKNRHITLKQLSQKTGISISFLSDIENGRSNPSLEKLKCIAVGLETPLSSLLEEDNNICINYPNNCISEKKSILQEPSDLKNALEDFSDLPPKAILEINEYIKYIRYKYSKKYF